MFNMNGVNSIFGILCDFSDEGVSAVLNFFKERIQNAKFQQDIDAALKNYKGGAEALEKDLGNFISVSINPEKEEKIKKKIDKIGKKGKSLKPSVSDYLDFFSIRTADEITESFIAFKAKDNVTLDDNSKKAFFDIILLSRKELVESYQSMISNESKAIIVTLVDMFEKYSAPTKDIYQTFYDVPEECPECSANDFHIDKEFAVCRFCNNKINLNSRTKTTLDEIHQSVLDNIKETHDNTLKAIEDSQNNIINKLDESQAQLNNAIRQATENAEKLLKEETSELSQHLSQKMDDLRNDNEKTREAMERKAAETTAETQAMLESLQNNQKENEKLIIDESKKTLEKLENIKVAILEFMENSAKNSTPNSSETPTKPRKSKTDSARAIVTDEDDDGDDWYEEDEDENENIITDEYIREGNKIFFGSYPQTMVTNSKLIEFLNKKSRPLPFDNKSQNWTSYGYYVNGKVVDFMWYIDIELKNKKYRGVYFTAQRPIYTTQSSFLSNYSFQDESGYDIGTVYWFEYKSISWTILTEDKVNKTALVASDTIIDAREYYVSKMAHRVNGKLVYPCCYEHSTIRNWLNDNFFNTAFNAIQQSFVKTATIENSPTTYGTSLSFSTFNSAKNIETTEDKVFLLSHSEFNSINGTDFSSNIRGNALFQKTVSDYAKAQGASTQQNIGEWWLRSPIHNNNSTFVCTVDCLGHLVSNGRSVDCVDKGIVPALYIKFK